LLFFPPQILWWTKSEKGEPGSKVWALLLPGLFSMRGRSGHGTGKAAVGHSATSCRWHLEGAVSGGFNMSRLLRREHTQLVHQQPAGPPSAPWTAFEYFYPDDKGLDVAEEEMIPSRKGVRAGACGAVAASQRHEPRGCFQCPFTARQEPAFPTDSQNSNSFCFLLALTHLCLISVPKIPPALL